MHKLPTAVNFAITACAASLTIGSFIHHLLGEDLVLDFVNATRLGVIIGILISTSMLGKNIQGLGLLINSILLGTRLSVQFYSEPTGPEPNPYFCLAALGIWIFVLAYFGSKHKLSSDEWQIAIASLLHFVLSAIVLILIT